MPPAWSSADNRGRPALDWHFDQTLLDAQAAVDGWYVLLTALTPEQADAAEVLRRPQGPGLRRAPLRRLQGPLAVTPSSCRTTRESARW
jgi:hypothetical protein